MNEGRNAFEYFRNEWRIEYCRSYAKNIHKSLIFADPSLELYQDQIKVWHTDSSDFGFVASNVAHFISKSTIYESPEEYLDALRWLVPNEKIELIGRLVNFWIPDTLSFEVIEKIYQNLKDCCDICCNQISRTDYLTEEEALLHSPRGFLGEGWGNSSWPVPKTRMIPNMYGEVEVEVYSKIAEKKGINPDFDLHHMSYCSMCRPCRNKFARATVNIHENAKQAREWVDEMILDRAREYTNYKRV